MDLSEEKEISNFRKKENFPVASVLMPKRARAAIMNLYVFARSADEISDNFNLLNAKRQKQLEEIHAALGKKTEKSLPEWAVPFLQSSIKGSYNIKHGLALLEAFIQDTVKKRYNSWEETLGYCQKSAATIGRMVLEANREFQADFEASDKICTVLQLLNHIQDLKTDYKGDDRLYFDDSFFGDLKDFDKNHESHDVTSGKIRLLNRLDGMINESQHLPKTMRGFRVRAEISVIIEVAKKLSAKLAKNDIFESRVELSKFDKVFCLVKGALKSLLCINFKKDKAKEISIHSKSSFIRPMLKMEEDRSRAMICFYAFCRVVDDAADDCTNVDEGNRQLNFWRSEVKKIYAKDNVTIPESAICRELAIIVSSYGIPKTLLDEIIAGQQMDLENQMLAPSMEQYEKYCYRVASVVGLVSIRIFGYEFKNRKKVGMFAENLGRALQTINIMRDIGEDAKRGRLYIPKEILDEVGIDDASAETVEALFNSKDKKIISAIKALSNLADGYKEIVRKSLPKQEEENMKPALLMKKVYDKYHFKMLEQNFSYNKEDVKLSMKEKLEILKG